MEYAGQTTDLPDRSDGWSETGLNEEGGNQWCLQ